MVGPTIGQGSFGHVMYARHKATDREVAIKVMDQVSMKKQPALFQAVWLERNLLQQLRDSPWVVNLLASFYDSHAVYLVMDLATFGDLEGLMATQSRSMDSCMNENGQQSMVNDWLYSCVPYLASQIITAVECLHTQHSILHCDLKPANILLMDDSPASKIGCMLRIQLADFGSAVELKDQSSPFDLSEQAQLLPRGTCHYASPEIVRGKPPSQLTVGSDYWSVGCILYAMLHDGSPPFQEKEGNEAQIIHSIVTHRTMDSQCRSRQAIVAPSGDYFPPGMPRHQFTMAGVKNSTAECESYSHEDVGGASPIQRWVSDMAQGLIQASEAERIASWRMNLCHRYKTDSDTKCRQANEKQLPTPAWRQQVQNSTLIDGKLGWSVFQAIL